MNTSEQPQKIPQNQKTIQQIQQELHDLGIQIAHIVAISQDHCIGKKNGMPWHIKEDLQHFKRLTTGNQDNSNQPTHAVQGIVIMGRKNFESIKSRPLPNRLNLIISRQTDYLDECTLKKDKVQKFADILHALEEAKRQAVELNLSTIWIIGGGEIFSQTLPIADLLEITQVEIQIEDGDAFYPDIPDNFSRKNQSSIHTCAENGLRFYFETYTQDQKSP